MDFESDDFLTVPVNENGAAKKFKPNRKGCLRRATPSALTGNHISPLTPNEIEPDQESLTVLSGPPNDLNSVDAVNNADEPKLSLSSNREDLISTEPLIGSQEAVATDDGGSKDAFFEGLHVNGVEPCQVSVAEQHSDVAEPTSLQWDPFDDIDLRQPTNTVNDGGRIRPKLKSFHMKKTVTSAKTELYRVAEENNAEKYSDVSYSISNVHGNNDMPEDSLEGGVPLDDTRRSEMGNSSFDLGLDVWFDVGTEGYPRSRCVPDKPLNNSIVMVEDENPPLSSVDQESNNCDSSHDPLIVGVTGNQLGMNNRDLATFEPSDIDCGRTEPESIYDSETGRTVDLLPDGDVHVETAQEIPANKVDDSFPADGTGVNKPLRVPRKRKARYTQPKEAVDRETDGLPGELGSESAPGQDASKDDNEGDTNLKKKVVKRSRKSGPDNVQQTRGRKKVNDTSSEQQEKPNKKFSHSTCARRKRVDPTFLATPDDEIDHTSVPFRDLILRAEYLERDSKKAPTPPRTLVQEDTERTEDPAEAYCSWYHNYETEQHEEHHEEQDDCELVAQETSSSFNYHSLMKKTKRVAWSKSDTETFYQGIRQFGTDFTLIQQLFKGRTRDQIKMKYKKEERQNPKSITEAIENRADGTSFFRQVIEQLTLAEAQKNKELNDFLNEAGINEGNDQEATLEDNDSTRFEESDVEVKYDDPEAIDTTDFQESEKIDDDEYYYSGWNPSP